MHGAFFFVLPKNVIMPLQNIYNANINKIRGFKNRQNAKLELFPSENRLAKHLHASVAFGFADRSAYGTHYETVADFLAPMGKSCCPLSWASVSFETQKHVAPSADVSSGFFKPQKAC
ncbi:hypothetical protein D3P08_00155 [Paenibacillus nanensis]|uniref:Uncharacterized protein n=1 Tax=Paenibacillus nanensis TaxID=393251 RepID=A0A3A1VNE4_9BACL|nr:hypothetical protein [Paenibacillus nanensis]RIX60043.1 hypothetical protein D3P08_00155 [Paenibacillus nanensis]